MEAKSSTRTTSVWKTILWGKWLLDSGVGWKVGDGHSIPILSSNWLSRKTNFQVLSPTKLSLETHFVVDLLTCTNSLWKWDIPKIKEYFLPIDADRILSIPI